jgi:CYTH domain-containing protein
MIDIIKFYFKKLSENNKRIMWVALNRNMYPENEDLTTLIYKLIKLIDEGENLNIKISKHHIEISNYNFNVVLWNANKYYSWLSINNINGVRYNGQQPSNNAKYDFYLCLKRNNYDNVGRMKGKIDFSKIKC